MLQLAGPYGLGAAGYARPITMQLRERERELRHDLQSRSYVWSYWPSQRRLSNHLSTLAIRPYIVDCPHLAYANRSMYPAAA